jgi:tetratricopeptide (TPR) repeat protein
MMARKLSKAARQVFSAVTMLGIGSFALRAPAEETVIPVRVAEPKSKIIVNPFAVPGAARPAASELKQPPAPRRLPLKYENPFSSKANKPPVDSPLRPGPVTRWRTPAGLADPSLAQKSVITSKPTEPAVIPWDQLPPAEDLRWRAPERPAEAKPLAASVARPLVSAPADPVTRSFPLISQPDCLATEPIDGALSSQSVFDISVRDITFLGQPSRATAQQRLIAAFNSDVLLASAEEPVSAAAPSVPVEQRAEPMPLAIVSDVEDTPRGWLEQAQQVAPNAHTIDDLTTVAELCARGLRGEPDQDDARSLRSLGAWAHNRRGELLAEAERRDEAIDDFQLAITLDPACSLAIHNRAVALAQQNQLAAALRDFDRVVELNPGLAIAYRNRAETLAALGRMAEAADDFTRAIESLPPDATLFGARAYAYQQLGKRHEALADINRAVELGADEPECFAQRASLLAETGSYNWALSDYRKALSQDPNCTQANRGLAWILATCSEPQFRDPQAALAAAEQAANTALPGDYLVVDTLAAACASVGQFERAATTAKQAIDIAPQEVVEAIKQRLALYEKGQPYVAGPQNLPVPASTPESDSSSPVARPSPTPR